MAAPWENPIIFISLDLYLVKTLSCKNWFKYFIDSLTSYFPFDVSLDHEYLFFSTKYGACGNIQSAFSILNNSAIYLKLSLFPFQPWIPKIGITFLFFIIL